MMYLIMGFSFSIPMISSPAIDKVDLKVFDVEKEGVAMRRLPASSAALPFGAARRPFSSVR